MKVFYKVDFPDGAFRGGVYHSRISVATDYCRFRSFYDDKVTCFVYTEAPDRTLLMVVPIWSMWRNYLTRRLQQDSVWGADYGIWCRIVERWVRRKLRCKNIPLPSETLSIS